MQELHRPLFLRLGLLLCDAGGLKPSIKHLGDARLLGVYTLLLTGRQRLLTSRLLLRPLHSLLGFDVSVPLGILPRFEILRVLKSLLLHLDDTLLSFLKLNLLLVHIPQLALEELELALAFGKLAENLVDIILPGRSLDLRLDGVDRVVEASDALVEE